MWKVQYVESHHLIQIPNLHNNLIICCLLFIMCVFGLGPVPCSDCPLAPGLTFYSLVRPSCGRGILETGGSARFSWDGTHRTTRPWPALFSSWYIVPKKCRRIPDEWSVSPVPFSSNTQKKRLHQVMVVGVCRHVRVNQMMPLIAVAISTKAIWRESM
jgi:hypothetical protein